MSEVEQAAPICGWPRAGSPEPCGEPPTVVFMTWPVPRDEYAEGRFAPVPSVLPLCAAHVPAGEVAG